MDVIELSIHGDIFLILNDLTLQEIEAVENYMYQCFVTNKRDMAAYGRDHYTTRYKLSAFL